MNYFGCGCGFSTGSHVEIAKHLKETGHKLSFGAKLLKRKLAEGKKVEGR